MTAAYVYAAIRTPFRIAQAVLADEETTHQEGDR
jgi:hypothetical protein